MNDDKRFAVALLLIRAGVMIVFAAWTLDKIVNPAHFNDMLQTYYHFTLSSGLLLVIGMIEGAVLLLFFFSNRFKNYTYGFILLAHTVSVLAESWRFFPPYERHMLLHFATLPMLAACLLLFFLRHRDVLLKIDSAVSEAR